MQPGAHIYLTSRPNNQRASAIIQIVSLNEVKLINGYFYVAGSDRIKVPAVGLNGEAGSRALFDFLPYNDNSGLLKVSLPFVSFSGFSLTLCSTPILSPLY